MKADEFIDVTGKTCPMPVLLTKKKIRTVESGKILEIVGDFPPAKNNIENFLNTNGHEVVEIQEEGGIYHIFTKIKG
ncbi:MAG: sulfurtransferase TusA family protein [Candidatus Helarchaeota archaeon]|nr:sulfurtransferase TusA family protein [Candidatus Helarchaeota archaeon]